MLPRMRILACLLPLSLTACADSQALEPVKTSLRCPELPRDLTAEARRKPVIKGEKGIEISGWLVRQVHVKNAALIRSIKLYNACRKT